MCWISFLFGVIVGVILFVVLQFVVVDYGQG